MTTATDNRSYAQILHAAVEGGHMSRDAAKRVSNEFFGHPDRTILDAMLEVLEDEGREVMKAIGWHHAKPVHVKGGTEHYVAVRAFDGAYGYERQPGDLVCRKVSKSLTISEPRGEVECAKCLEYVDKHGLIVPDAEAQDEPEQDTHQNHDAPADDDDSGQSSSTVPASGASDHDSGDDQDPGAEPGSSPAPSTITRSSIPDNTPDVVVTQSLGQNQEGEEEAALTGDQPENPTPQPPTAAEGPLSPSTKPSSGHLHEDQPANLSDALDQALSTLHDRLIVVADKDEDEGAWLEARRHSLGSSDAPSIFGQGYLDAYEVWAVKAGKIEPKQRESDWLEWGHYMEPAAVAWASKKLGATYRLNSTMFRHPKREWQHATPDAFAWSDEFGGLGIIEAKNVTYWERIPEFDEEPPMREVLQVIHQKAVCQPGGVKWVALSVVLSGRPAKVYVVPVTDKMIRWLTEHEIAFAEKIHAGTPPREGPPPEEILNALHPEDTGRVVRVDDPGVLRAHRQYQLARKNRKAAESAYDAAKLQIKWHMAQRGDAARAVIEDPIGVWEYTWKTYKNGHRPLRSKRLKSNEKAKEALEGAEKEN